MTAPSRPHPPLLLDDARGVERFLDTIRDAPVLAVDTEGASFHRYVNRIYLLQLSTRDSTAVIDPLAVRPPAALGEILTSQRVQIVFHDADYDLRLLHRDYGWHVANIFDTRIAAQLVGVRSFGLAALAEQYVGAKLDKRHQRADWSMRPLPRDMLEYAAQDTAHLIEISDRLRAELERLGRWSWAAEEFERLEGTRWDEGAEDGDAYLRLKGARDLSRRELAVLRELVRWRDGVARQLDRASFRVATNEALLEAARAAPRSREALAAVKGMPRGMVGERAAEMLAAIDRALRVPDDQLPRFPRAPRWERDPDFDDNVSRLRTVRDAAAQRLDLDPGVLCPRDRLEAIARRRPATVAELAEVAGLRRWQIGELGGEFVRALQVR